MGLSNRVDEGDRGKTWTSRQSSISMSTVIRRFISCIGKVKLSEFKATKYMTLIDKYRKRYGSRVSHSHYDMPRFVDPTSNKIRESRQSRSRDKSSQITQGPDRCVKDHFYEVSR